MFFNDSASLLSHRAVPNLHGDVDVTTPSLNVVGIERFGNLPSQDATLSARFAIVQALPGFENIGAALFLG